MTKKQKIIKESFNELNKKITLNTSNTIVQKLENMLNIIKEHGSKLKTETISVCFHLGTDAKKTDQNVKTSAEIPNGWMSKKKIGLFTTNVFTSDNPNITIGGADLIEQIKTNKTHNFDICIAHPSFEKSMNSIAKILQKTSPNKKTGTLTENCDKVAMNLANNQIKILANETNMLYTTIGTSDMSVESLLTNLLKIIEVINSCKPAKLKTNMIKRMYISSTQLSQSILVSMRELSLYATK